MGPSLNRFKGKASEPASQRKPTVEQPLLLELLPAPALDLASSLSDEEKEVLVYLVLYGRNALLTSEASNSGNKAPWKPWKSFLSKVDMRQQVCTSCPGLGILTTPMTSTEQGISKCSPLPLVKFSRSFSCDCFTCYSRIWSRWIASPNRDVINDVLEVIESIPQGIQPGSKGKKKKKLERKREVLEMIREKDESTYVETTLASRGSSLGDHESHALELLEDDLRPSTAAEKTNVGRKKGLFRGMRQRETVCLLPPNVALVAGVEQNASPAVVSVASESETGTKVVAIESFENLPIEPSSCGDPGLSLAGPRGKDSLKPHQHHRMVKRRSNQVTPLDCEEVTAVEREQLAVIELENTEVLTSPRVATEVLTSPRVADAELGGRGFLARVFPDTLGRVASRLWDIVSFRLRSRTVEYH